VDADAVVQRFVERLVGTHGKVNAERVGEEGPHHRKPEDGAVDRQRHLCEGRIGCKFERPAATLARRAERAFALIECDR